MACGHFWRRLITQICSSRVSELKLAGSEVACTRIPELNTFLSENANSVTDIDLAQTNIGDEGLAALAPVLEKCYKLKKLNVSECSLTAESRHVLISLWASLPNLQVLKLAGNNISDDTMAALAVGLQLCEKLTKLDVTNCKVTAAGCDELKMCITLLMELEELHLASNDICDDGMAALAPGLQLCAKLRKLDVTNCKLTAVGCDVLRMCIALLFDLEELYLASNNIGDGGMAALAAGLPLCAKLTKLDVSNCKLTAVSCDVLSGVCAPLCNLRVLQLDGNAIGDVGAQKLSFGLQHCQLLCKLSLSQCSLSSRSLVAISSLVSSLRTLRELYLGGNDFSDDDESVHIGDFGLTIRNRPALTNIAL